ncbi:FkbM family methyltransferase [Flavobacterium johnsoniae]|uniref:FkbM family methyltransferase n=1 Tax=Flavobacterium johnsoniae TaxID=986 RepID=UPI0025AF012F|nr:FkbM family methyltransferase [Flavobacterium johnsoniae]WJS95144.1 FkbM family methyltransferase [Flavobacterium johnsoniae]
MIKKIINKINRRLSKVNLSSSDEYTEYFFENLNIRLKNNHALSVYQKKFPLYDRFLPVLCSNLDGLIIDVGANIGDTIISIFDQNKQSFIVGIEPDDLFFTECKYNINTNKLNHRFLGIQKFLTTNKGSFSLEKSSTQSTGAIFENLNDESKINTISFAEVIKLIPLEKRAKFDLLKIDTDGFDWDVINSFLDYSKTSDLKPRFIFFEMQTYMNNIGFHDKNRDKISERYKLAIENLAVVGYNYFGVFDNFGTPLKITKSIEDIFEINEYIKRSQVFNSNATIYYLDVLAFTSEDLNYVNDSVFRFLNKSKR